MISGIFNFIRDAVNKVSPIVKTVVGVGSQIYNTARNVVETVKNVANNVAISLRGTGAVGDQIAGFAGHVHRTASGISDVLKRAEPVVSTIRNAVGVA